jgi:hypothetical protein
VRLPPTARRARPRLVDQVRSLVYHLPPPDRQPGLARTRLPAALSSASYDAANRLTSWAGTTLSHDNNGNLLGDGTRTYTWNARNQLSGVSGTPAASFQYDALMQPQTRSSGVSYAK